MKSKDLTKMRAKSVKILAENVSQKKLEITRLYAEYKAGRDVNPTALRDLKLDIAQILTIIREKELIDQAKDDKSEDSKK